MAGNTAGQPGTLAGCAYERDSVICGQAVRARGYCAKHYKVMARAGAFNPERPISGDPETVERNIGHLDRARLLLQENTAVLVQNLLDAAAVAAKRGDSKPAEWALLHSRTLEPVLTGGAAQPKGQADSGVKVIIGVQLSGTVPGTVPLPSGVQTVVLSPQSPDQSPGTPDNAGSHVPSAPALQDRPLVLEAELA